MPSRRQTIIDSFQDVGPSTKQQRQKQVDAIVDSITKSRSKKRSSLKKVLKRLSSPHKKTMNDLVTTVLESPETQNKKITIRLQLRQSKKKRDVSPSIRTRLRLAPSSPKIKKSSPKIKSHSTAKKVRVVRLQNLNNPIYKRKGFSFNGAAPIPITFASESVEENQLKMENMVLYLNELLSGQKKLNLKTTYGTCEYTFPKIIHVVDKNENLTLTEQREKFVYEAKKDNGEMEIVKFYPEDAASCSGKFRHNIDELYGDLNWNSRVDLEKTGTLVRSVHHTVIRFKHGRKYVDAHTVVFEYYQTPYSTFGELTPDQQDTLRTKLSTKSFGVKNNDAVVVLTGEGKLKFLNVHDLEEIPGLE